MRSIRLAFAFIIFSSCATVHSQNSNSLDALFKENLAAFERVSDGSLTRNQLATQQVAFLYLIADWSSRPTQYDHYKDLVFTSNDVKFWKQWYSTNKQSLSPEDIQKAVNLQVKLITEGLLPDNDMEFLTNLSEKLRKL